MSRITPFAAVILVAAAPSFAALPFTISKETTAITEPLNPDGSPDYITALNNLYSKGVTPENNAFTAWLEVTGTQPPVLSEKTRDKIIQLAGVRDLPLPTYTFFNDILKAHNLSPTETNTAEDNYYETSRRLWRAKDYPYVDETLTADREYLDKMHEVWARPRFWMPYVSSDGRSTFGVLLPSLGRMRDAANLLGARCTFRIAANDFSGFLSDVMTLKHMAHLLAKQPTLIERLVGISINAIADRVICVACASGQLTAAECDQLSNALADLPAFTPMSEAVNIFERWSQLDTVILVATGHTDLLSNGQDHSFDRFASVDTDQVDWNTILIRFNQLDDQLIAAMNRPTLEEQQIAVHDFDHAIASGSATQRSNSAGEMHKLSEEARDAYTQRVTQALVSTIFPSLGRADEIYRQTLMFDDIALTFIALAKYHAEQKSWPETLDPLVPNYASHIPLDLYSPGQGDPIRYTQFDAGPCLYSIGRNHLDDGAINDSATHRDDLPFGAAPPPVPPQNMP